MNKHAQSIVEYALIAILVILGVVFMGSYVLRSINAHYKLWDEGTQDSFTETLNQAPVNVLPSITANCQCTPVNESCGNPTAGASLCPANQREVDLNCTIEGCAGMAGKASCVDDPTCCSTAVALGCGLQTLTADALNGNVGSVTTCPPGTSATTECGLQTLTADALNGNVRSVTTCRPGTSATTCYCPAGSSLVACPAGTAAGVTCCSAPPATNISPCYYGYQIWGNQCGSSSADVCVLDSKDCQEPKCGAFSLFPDSFTYCPAPPPNSYATGLTQNTGITIQAKESQQDCACTTDADCQQVVSSGSKCSSGQCTNCTWCDASGPPCQVYCNSPYVYNKKDNECDLQFTVAALSCDAITNSKSTASVAPTCTGDMKSGNLSCTGCSNPPCCGFVGSESNPNGGGVGDGLNDYTVIINNQSFTACASASTIIGSASFQPAGYVAPDPDINEVNGGCGNSQYPPRTDTYAEGQPGQTCDISVGFGSSS